MLWLHNRALFRALSTLDPSLREMSCHVNEPTETRNRAIWLIARFTSSYIDCTLFCFQSENVILHSVISTVLFFAFSLKNMDFRSVISTTLFLLSVWRIVIYIIYSYIDCTLFAFSPRNICGISSSYTDYTLFAFSPKNMDLRPVKLTILFLLPARGMWSVSSSIDCTVCAFSWSTWDSNQFHVV